MAALIAVLAAGACASQQDRVDAAIMPRTTAGTPVVSDIGAIEYASYELGQPSRTQDRPGDAALAVASVEYLASALYTNPHWVGIPSEHKLQMQRGRDEVRAVLGVAPATPSQTVLNALVAASTALGANDVAAARAALPTAIFTRGPDATIAVLRNLPPLPAADIAAQNVNADTTTNCQLSQNCG